MSSDAVIIFDPSAIEQQLKADMPAALRNLADAIERGDLRAWAPQVNGNGFLKTQYGRVAFDVRFSIDAAPIVRRELPDEIGGAA